MNIFEWLFGARRRKERKAFLQRVCVDHSFIVRFRGLGYSAHWEAKCSKCGATDWVSILDSSEGIYLFVKKYEANR